MNTFVTTAHTYFILCIGVSSALLFFAPLQSLQAATLQLVADNNAYAIGQTFTAEVLIDPQAQNIASAEISLEFDSQLLSVVDIQKANSAIATWTTEPTFSNGTGRITFSGDMSQSVIAPATLITITFRAVATGTSLVDFSDVLLQATDADSNIYDTGTPASFVITAASAGLFSDPPTIMQSQSFPNPDTWYGSAEGVFRLSPPVAAKAVAIKISTSSSEIPSADEAAIFEPIVREFRVSAENVTDGIQYINLQFRSDDDWSEVISRSLKIDTVSPAPFAIHSQSSRMTDGFPHLSFTTTDDLSGIDYYEVVVADSEPVVMTADEARFGYFLKDIEDGTYVVTVVAYDRAGNTRESQMTVSVSAGWTASNDASGDMSLWTVVTPASAVSAVLLTTVGFLIWLLWSTRKKSLLREERLKRETQEVEDQMSKIFSALRDEIYDQINTINQSKKLTKKEMAAVEGLHQALTVSEILIEKEINDVKSILT